MKSYKYVIWDWNGTLLDDVYIALEAVNRTLRKRNMDDINIEQYYSYIEMPIIKFYEHLFDLNEVPFSVLSKEFNEYSDEQEELLKLHFGANEKLEQFKKLGYSQIIVSAAHIDGIVYYLNKFGIFDYFDAVLGADDFLAESKVERAKKYFIQNKINPDEAVLIGDCVHDYETAQGVGCDCILVSCGHQSENDLKKTGCRVFNAISEIVL